VPYRTDQLWYADIIYIRIATSFVYLAALLDGISKRNTGSLIHHSDQGIQYCSQDYVKVLKDNGITISMS